jgi:predicted DNA-binding protein YlxM (UPF0122 family)
MKSCLKGRVKLDKRVKISFLLDFYGNLLTEKQLEAVELYHGDDLSLSEIADNQGISRQGVRDAIKRSEEFVLEMEQKLHLAEGFLKIQQGFLEISKQAKEIEDLNVHYGFSSEISKRTRNICNIVKKISV